jgi:hypothetical protein
MVREKQDGSKANMNKKQSVMGEMQIKTGRGSHPTLHGGAPFVSKLFLSIPAGTDKHSFLSNKVENLLSLCRRNNKSIYLTQFKPGLRQLS